MFDVLHSQLIPGLKEASYNNRNLFKLMYGQDISTREMLDGIATLDQLLYTYPLIDSLYLYNGQKDYFISTSNGLQKSEDFFDKDVLNIVNKHGSNRIESYLPRDAVHYAQNTAIGSLPVLTLFMGIPTKDNRRLNGALISNIDVLELDKLLSTKYGSQSDEIFVINGQGELICQSNRGSNTDFNSIFPLLKKHGKERGTLITVNNQLVSYQFNYSLGWYFIGVIPLDHINQEIFTVSRTSFIIMLGILFLSVVLSYFATRKVYKPIDSLMHIMAGDVTTESSYTNRDSHEMSFISNKFKNILNRNISLEGTLLNLQDDYRLEILRSIIDGQEYHSWEEELSTEDMDLIRNPLSMFLIQIDNYYRIAQEMEPEALRSFRKSIVEIIQENIWDFTQTLVDMDNRNIICLFSGEPEEYLKVMEVIQTTLKQNLSCSVSISWIHRQNWNVLRLKEMYPKVLSAVGGKFSTGFGAIVPYSNQDKSSIIYPGDISDRLFQFMRQGDIAGVIKKLEELVNILKGGTYQDFIQFIRIFVYRILRFLKDRDVKEVQSLLQNIASSPQTLETLDNFKIVFQDILESVFKQLEKPGRKSITHFNLIHNYVEGHYKDVNCCVQSIADKLDLSPNYLRQIYKNHTGISLSDSLVSKRIDEACRLLLETCDSVKEIYEPAGFTNYNSFFTCFKRIKGETPAEFRRKSSKL
ncbi:MAG: AraC family transcriptional regulator [Spirochaetaceae bacterium]